MSSLPEDLVAALRSAGLTAFFADCTSAHRREYLRWISEAKRPETRQNRIREALRRLSQKKTEEEAKSGRQA
jgi:uncharacterized protein YdeI (YjbR/CyaY-like superfamily)